MAAVPTVALRLSTRPSPISFSRRIARCWDNNTKKKTPSRHTKQLNRKHVARRHEIQIIHAFPFSIEW